MVNNRANQDVASPCTIYGKVKSSPLMPLAAQPNLGGNTCATHSPVRQAVRDVINLVKVREKESLVRFISLMFDKR
jgi:hypothetical protein